MTNRQRSRVFTSVLIAAMLVGHAAVATTPVQAALPASSVDRVSGLDRYATSIAVSQRSYPNGAATAVLVTGENYPDALVAAPAARTLDAPLLLSPSAQLSSAVKAELVRLGVSSVVIVGGVGAVSTAVEDALTSMGLTVVRHAGADRYETAARVVDAHFATAPTVYLATGGDFPDSLAASAAASRLDAPLFIADGRAPRVSDSVLAQFEQLGVATVRVAGGPGVMPDSLVRDLSARGYAVERYGGADRYATALAVAQSVGMPLERVFLATGDDFPDALSGATLSALESGSLLLSNSTCLNDVVHQALAESPATIRLTLVGGEGVLSAAVFAGTTCAELHAQQRSALEQRLLDAVRSSSDRAPGTYSISVRQLDGLRASVDLRGGTMQEPASVMKIFAVYAALKRIEQGRLYYSTRTASGVTVADCMRVSIHISDNSCHWDLVDLIGRQALNDLFASEGFRATVYEGRRWNGTYYATKHTTTADVANLLARLHNGSLLEKPHADYFVTLLETQLWRSRLPSSVPTGVPVANKVGQLWRSTGMIEADAAIVVGARTTYTIAVIGSNGATVEGVRDIGRAVSAVLLGSSGSFASYSNLNLRTTARVPYYRYLSDLRAGRAPAGWLPAGTRLEADQGHRLVYQVIYNGRAVFMESRFLVNAIPYPRSRR